MTGYEQKLARVLDAMGGLYLVDDLLSAIAEDRMQSFSIGNSWAITQVNQFPRAKRLQIVAAVGDMGDMVALHDRILEYASDINAGLVSTIGRRGWMPQAREHGWRLKAKNYLYQRDM
jgi:hypothetical protein